MCGHAGLSLEYGSALVEHRETGPTGYERAGACREFSAQARDGGANDRCDVGARQNFRCHWPVMPRTTREAPLGLRRGLYQSAAHEVSARPAVSASRVTLESLHGSRLANRSAQC
jgi:hypothetical protein